MRKNSVCRGPYLRNHTSYDFHYGTRVENDNTQEFFLFFENFDFLGCWEGPRSKMAQNGKKLCLLHFIYQEPYII